MHKVYISTVPVLTSLLIMYTSSSYVSMGVCALLIASSLGNLLLADDGTYDMLVLCNGIGVLLLFVYHMYGMVRYLPCAESIMAALSSGITMSVLPIVFSLAMDMCIVAVLARKHAIILKIAGSVLLAVALCVMQDKLFYDWRVVLPMAVLPSFVLMLLLPNDDQHKTSVYKRVCTRISCLVTVMVIGVGVLACVAHLVKNNRNMASSVAINVVSDLLAQTTSNVSRAVGTVGNAVSNAAGNVSESARNFVDQCYERICGLFWTAGHVE